jgi:hypothetical protein
VLWKFLNIMESLLLPEWSSESKYFKILNWTFAYTDTATDHMTLLCACACGVVNYFTTHTLNCIDFNLEKFWKWVWLILLLFPCTQCFAYNLDHDCNWELFQLSQQSY